MIVPNKFPSIPSSKKIALVGEAPGADEDLKGEPFCGASGRFLAALLSRAGVSREQAFLGNICQHKPPGNDFAAFGWQSVQVQTGMLTLRDDLQRFQPNIVVLLGNVPLKAAKDFSGNGKKYRFSNANWRGSVFRCEDEASPFYGFKCIAAYHPAYCLRDYNCTPLLQFDLRKAVGEADSPTLHETKRDLRVDLTPEQIITELGKIRESRLTVAIDIEGYVDDMSCISFATSETSAFIVPFRRRDGSSCDTPEVWRALAECLEDPHVGKVLQNSLYDRFVLHYGYGIRVQGVVGDTMLAHWELYSELEKSLAVQASLYTNQPYYKQDRKSDDDRTFFEYCCRDSCITLEIHNKLMMMLKGTSLEHYKLNLSLLNPMLYMELRGIAYGSEPAFHRREALRTKMFEAQARLNTMTGYGFKWQNIDEITNRVRELMWTKKGDRVYKDYQETNLRAEAILSVSNPVLAHKGEIEDLCEVSLNVDSSKQFIPYLYETLKLPTQYSDDKENPVPTANYEALLKLSRELQKTPGDPRLPVVQTAIEIRALRTRQAMLSIQSDPDFRIRCGYNVVGTNTGRITCYESPTGSGYNLQTIPNYTSISEAPGGVLGDRDLFLADVDQWFFQCDLSGADGWTVAAYSAMLGDPTMLLDYRAGISPFKVLTLKLLGKPVPKDRAELAEAVKVIHKDSWERFAMKRVQHGGCYLEGGLTISRNILKDSEGKLYMPPKECDAMKEYMLAERYWGVRKWHKWVADKINPRTQGKSVMVMASGHVRHFFGRPDEILTKAVAAEPQHNTTYAIKLAMYKLWTDPENRTLPLVETELPSGHPSKRCLLRIEPLHTVHDSLNGQFKKADTAWASIKIKSYLANELTIAGQKITIPYEGGFGPSWGNLNEGKL